MAKENKKPAAQSAVPAALQKSGEKFKIRKRKKPHKLVKKSKNQELEISQKEVKHHLDALGWTMSRTEK